MIFVLVSAAELNNICRVFTSSEIRYKEQKKDMIGIQKGLFSVKQQITNPIQ